MAPASLGSGHLQGYSIKSLIVTGAVTLKHCSDLRSRSHTIYLILFTFLGDQTNWAQAPITLSFEDTSRRMGCFLETEETLADNNVIQKIDLKNLRSRGDAFGELEICLRRLGRA